MGKLLIKKIKHLKKFFVALFAVASLAACSKDDDNNTNCDETTAAIAGTYKITKVTAAGVDVTASIPECERNATWVLNANGTVSYTEPTTCTGGNGTGNWSVTGTTIAITQDGMGSDFSGTVTNNCTNITISESIAGAAYVTTMTRQ